MGSKYRYLLIAISCILIVSSFVILNRQSGRSLFKPIDKEESGKEKFKALSRCFPDSSYEWNAVHFLIANMPGHYSLVGEERDKYIEYFKAYGRSKSSAKEIKDSLIALNGVFDMSALTPVADVNSISPHFLTKEIKDAVRIWQSYPWSSVVPFERFSEYILPYRLENEVLSENWHGAINNELKEVLDSIEKQGVLIR